MAFSDFLKNVGTAALEGVQKFGEKNIEYKDKWDSQYSRMSDDRLIEEHKRFRNGGIYSSQHERVIRMNCLAEEMRNRGLIR